MAGNVHNAHRTNRAGRGTFKQVMKRRVIHKHQVKFATLTREQQPVVIRRSLSLFADSTFASNAILPLLSKNVSYYRPPNLATAGTVKAR